MSEMPKAYDPKAVEGPIFSAWQEGGYFSSAIVEGAQPFVIPFSYHYDDVSPRSIYLHGSTISRAIKQLASGAPVCVTVTLLDALVTVACTERSRVLVPYTRTIAQEVPAVPGDLSMLGIGHRFSTSDQAQMSGRSARVSANAAQFFEQA